ncbi:aspartic peptidase domain-containing protein [Scleroderma yunnanense]
MNTLALRVAQGSRLPLSSEATIGGQKFWVTLDTGSSDLWVVSTKCSTSECQEVVKYSPERSHTMSLSGKPFNITYLVGSASGIVGTETVTLGPYQIPSQTFALANRTDNLDLVHTKNSGILGLAFPSLVSIEGTTVLDNVFDQLSSATRFFAFKLGRYNSRTGISSTSSFTIGGLDPLISSDASQMAFFPVFRTHDGPYDFWKLPIRAITINSQPLPLSHTVVPGADTPIGVLDTGTTLILGPSNDIEVFWNAVGTGNSVRYNQQSQIWEVRCNRAIDIRIKLGDGDSTKEFALHPEDIIWDQNSGDDGWCTGGLQASKVNSGDWILGDAFLRNVYTVHQGATSSTPPMIGLLGVTDPQSALADFQSVRGPDPAPAPNIPTIPYSDHPQSDVSAIVSMACVVGGLVVAGLVIFIYKTMRMSKWEKARVVQV